MNVFVFQNRFEADILAGRKPHTIRGHRRDGRPRAKVGETISLRVWTGKPYRSKQREFAQATVEHVFSVTITTQGISRPHPEIRKMLAESVELDRSVVARRDGFKHWREMKAWFAATHGLPFTGELVAWKELVS